MKKNEIVKPSLKTFTVEGCKFEEYSKNMNAMTNCGKEIFEKGLCKEHYDYIISIRGKV